MPFTCDCQLHSVPLTTSTQPQRPDFLCINIIDCNVKRFGFNEHLLLRSSFLCIIFTGSKWDTVWLLRTVFGSTSAFSSSFYHCDLWMIKRKRNQKLFSTSTICIPSNDNVHQTMETSVSQSLYWAAASSDVTQCRYNCLFKCPSYHLGGSPFFYGQNT